MITYKEIKQAINDKIKAAFPDIPIQSQDIEEGFNRPSFFTEFENVNTKDVMNYFKDRNLSVKIFYFPSSKYKNSIEILEVQENLENVFVESLKIKDAFIVTINEIEQNVTDGVLQCQFDIEMLEEYDEHYAYENQELMEVLEFNIEK